MQAIVGIVVFTMPGIFLLKKLTRGSEASWPAAFVLAPAFLLSSLVVTAFQALTITFLPPHAARIATWALLIVILAYTALSGWKEIGKLTKGICTWERRMWVLLGTALALWILLMPLSPYPAQMNMGLGDRPGYYRVAANLVSGRGWLADFFIGDYVGGYPSYLVNHPLPALVITFFFQVFGSNAHSLTVYGALAGTLCVSVLASFVSVDERKEPSNPWIFIGALIALGVPSHYYLLGLGASTVPGTLAFLTAVVFLVEHVDTLKKRIVVCAICVIYMLVVRPEAAILGVLLVACFALFAFLCNSGIRARWRLVACLGIALVVAGAWLKLPEIVGALPSNLRNLCIFFLQYDQDVGQFQWMYAPWWKINEMLCTMNFSLEETVPALGNDAIAEEILGHPAAFFSFLTREFYSTTSRLLGAINIGVYLRPSPVMRGLTGLIFIFAFVHPRNRIALCVILLQLFIFPLVNAGFGARHLLPVASALYALFGRAIFARPRWMLTRLGMAVVALFIAGNTIDIAAIRIDDFNRGHAVIIDDLRKIAKPDDLIASSYPQLLASEVGCPTVGCTWLTDNLEGLVARTSPDIIVVDDKRDGPKNYRLLKKRHELKIAGYQMVRHNSEERYAIFVKEAGTEPGGSEPDNQE